MFKFKYLFILCSAFVMSCGGGYYMVLNDGLSNINLTQKSIALLSVKISNQNHPSYQLKFTGSVVCPQYEKCSNRKHYHYANPPYKSEKDSFDEYLMSFGLESGTYNIHHFGTYCRSFTASAFADVPLNLKTEIKPNTISYLGHIDVTLRGIENDTEERAAILPFLDAFIVGYSSGTFDVVVEDRYDYDMKLFISEYPELKDVKVEKAILPQWIRPENNPDR